MFELRGLSRDALHAELVKSPLGQILSSALKSDDVLPEVEPVESYYAHPAREADAVIDSHKEFWTGGKRVAAPPAAPSPGRGTAPQLDEEGEYAPFLHQHAVFVD